MSTTGSSNRKPVADWIKPPGYYAPDGTFQNGVKSELGLQIDRMFAKTSKFELYQIALYLAMRLNGNESEKEALDTMEREKATLKANGII